MRKTTGADNVSGEFENYVDGVTPGTVITAQWGNDVQSDLIAIQTEAGVPEGAGSLGYVMRALRRLNREWSMGVGDTFQAGYLSDPVSWDIDNPETYFPAICLNGIDGSESFSGTDWPDLITALRAVKLVYAVGKAGEISDFPGTVSGSTITLDDTAGNNALLTHLAAWQTAFGTYTDWLNATISGVEYAITNVNAATRVITVSGSPPTGSQDTSIYPHRVAGNTDVFRLHEIEQDVSGAPESNLYTYIHGGRYAG